MDLQEAIVVTLARDISGEWERIVVNYEMQEEDGGLVEDRPGKFRFSFSYDPPKRISGIYDDDSMGRFDRYLETYEAERASSPW
jgi:hypothetical protein